MLMVLGVIPIVLWETISNKSIVDILWEQYEQRKRRKTEKLIGSGPGSSREDGESRDASNDASSG